MRVSAAGLGLAPGDSCYDPQHPWWLPNLMHTAYECACMTRQNRSTEEQCVFAMPGGSDATYTKPDDVPNLAVIALETPGWLAGGATEAAGIVIGSTVRETVSGAGKGLNESLGWQGYATIAVVGAIAVFLVMQGIPGGRR